MEVAVVGGGVAGVSSAILLKQRGHDVTLFERYPSPATIGAGIVVWPNASYVLEQLGVLREIAALSGGPTRMCRISSSNDELGAIDIEAINRAMGYPSFSILRRDLQAILTARLESLGVAVRYDHLVTNIETKKGETKVVFQNGREIGADLIIGADGRMASQARRYVHGDNRPVYQGFINWVGVFESEAHAFDEIAVADYWGVGERFGIVPVAQHKAYWAGAVASPRIGPRGGGSYKQELASIFSAWPDPICTMIEHTPEEKINKLYVHDHNPIRVWHKNNVILLGDAAHAPLPTSGQGACQALEDAWHLVNCLAECPDNLQGAFAKFTAMRFEKTTAITMAAREFASSLFNGDEAFCRRRNENSRRTDFAQAAVGMARFWGRGLPLIGS